MKFIVTLTVLLLSQFALAIDNSSKILEVMKVLNLKPNLAGSSWFRLDGISPYNQPCSVDVYLSAHKGEIHKFEIATRNKMISFYNKSSERLEADNSCQSVYENGRQLRYTSCVELTDNGETLALDIFTKDSAFSLEPTKNFQMELTKSSEGLKVRIARTLILTGSNHNDVTCTIK